ncbi:MAG TPA: hypothetical protein VFQ52_09270 [Rhizomicrobium sp.]|nr:hypothetical protein [Rhizomicrobium sp.]
MSNLQDFHHGSETRSRTARWIVGLVIAAVLAVVAFYAWRAATPPDKPRPVLEDSKLPSP